MAFDQPDRIKARMDEINQEIRQVTDQIHERQLKGKPVEELEKRLEELEARKHEIVEQKAALWSS
jgi:archaellum component FlaC